MVARARRSFEASKGRGANTDMGRKSKKTKSAKTEIKRLLPQRPRMDMSAKAELRYHGLY